MPASNKHDHPAQAAVPQEPMRADALVDLLEVWMHGDQTEQRETFEALRHSLDENRPRGYKLFS